MAATKNGDLFRETQSTQIGLYVGLREGQELDLRVAAKAALAFDDFMRAFVSQIEPETEISLTFRKSEIGSLNIISTIKAKVNKQMLVGIAAGAATWLGMTVAGYSVETVLDEIRANLSEEEKSELSEKDLERIAEACLKATKSHELSEKTNAISQVLSEDDAVTGLGLTVGAEKKPRVLRHRSAFPAAISKSALVDQETQEKISRVTEVDRDLILTEPVLIDKPRKWRFMMGKIEISAYIRDETFRQKALQGKLGVPLSQGIEIRAKIKTTEQRLETDLWKPVKYEIMHVTSWKAEPAQLTLAMPSPQKIQRNHNGE